MTDAFSRHDRRFFEPHILHHLAANALTALRQTLGNQCLDWLTLLRCAAVAIRIRSTPMLSIAVTLLIAMPGCSLMTQTNDVIHIDGQSFLGDGTKVYQQGLHAYRKGNFTRAAERFEQVLRLNPSDGRAHNNLGLILYDERKLVLAAEHFDAAANLLPDDATPLNNLGMTLESGGRVSEALELYEQAAYLEPDNPLYLGNSLRARIRMGEHSELVSEQLKDLAFIETRPEWTSWVDEQLALHRNPTLDRGPAVDERLGVGSTRPKSERPGALIESEPIELSPSMHLYDGQSESTISETLPVPVPR